MNYKKLLVASFICASILSVSSAYSQEFQAKVAKGVSVYKKYQSIDKMIEYNVKPSCMTASKYIYDAVLIKFICRKCLTSFHLVIFIFVFYATAFLS